MSKDAVIICRCEDITLQDVEEAFEKGFRDIESLRRYLKLGTGPCQGKTCIPILQRILCTLKGTNAVEDITVRPPETPIPLAIFVKKEHQ